MIESETRHLSAPGEWRGPIHGERGVLAVDEAEGKVQCHVCGRWYVYLAVHLRHSHKLHPDDYKEIFGLNATTGLVGPRLRERQAEIARRVFGPHWSSEMGKQLTSAERSAYARGRKWRLEALTNPQTREAWRQRGLRNYQEGKWHPPAAPPAGAAAKGAARIRELMRDPTYRERFSQRVREAAAARVLVRCAVCDKEFEALRHQVARGEKKVCRRECFREYRRRHMAEHNYHQENEDFHRVVETLTALDPAAWERLSERERDVTRLYYGLADGRPWRQREIGERLGLQQPSVHRSLRRALADLLGQPTDAILVDTGKIP